MPNEFGKQDAAGRTPHVAIEVRHNIASERIALDATTEADPLRHAVVSTMIGLQRPWAEAGSELR